MNDRIYRQALYHEAPSEVCPSVGKEKYSKREAQEARNRCRKRGSGDLRIYHCFHCNGWHLTKEEKGTRVKL